MKPTEITKKEITDWIGRPVWYRTRSNRRDFGWAIVKESTPYTVTLTAKDGDVWRNWENVNLYDRPAVRRICADCRHWIPATPGADPAHCECGTAGKPFGCTAATGYKDFDPADPDDKLNKNMIIRDYLRALKLGGWLQKGA